MPLRDLNRRSDSAELVRLWVLADGTRCVLAAVANELELRIIHEGAIVRRAPCVDIRLARDSAAAWRVDYEIEHAAHWPRGKFCQFCPECGEEAVLNGHFPDSVRWLGCSSCGNVWLDESDKSKPRGR